MTARQLRRAHDRQAVKAARKAATLTPRAIPQPETPAASSSDARLAANRANAQLSTGPRTEDGKAVSSLNAVKTGLTGRTVLLPGDDAVAYSALIAAFLGEWQPATDAERRLVQSLADTEWRLLRIPALEAGIYAIGRLQAADQFPGEADEAVRRSLIEANVFLAYQRQLNNLSIQENRLRRQRQKDTAELQRLQQERQQRASETPSAGFEFSSGSANDRAPWLEALPNGNSLSGAVTASERPLTAAPVERLRQHAAGAEESGLD